VFRNRNIFGKAVDPRKRLVCNVSTATIEFFTVQCSNEIEQQEKMCSSSLNTVLMKLRCFLLCAVHLLSQRTMQHLCAAAVAVEQQTGPPGCPGAQKRSRSVSWLASIPLFASPTCARRSKQDSCETTISGGTQQLILGQRHSWICATLESGMATCAA